MIWKLQKTKYLASIIIIVWDMECFSGLFSKLQTIFMNGLMFKGWNIIPAKVFESKKPTTYVSPHYVNDDRVALISSKICLTFLMHYILNNVRTVKNLQFIFDLFVCFCCCYFFFYLLLFFFWLKICRLWWKHNLVSNIW